MQRDTGWFSFPWVHTSDQPETTWARTAIFSAWAFYKVLTPKRLQCFTLEEFFHQKWRGEKRWSERRRECLADLWISREVYMCWMNDSEPLAGCRSNRAEWIKEKWFCAWWMSPYHLIYSSSGGGRKCIMLFVSISRNRDNLWIISIRWKPTSVVKHGVFSKNIGIHTNIYIFFWLQFWIHFNIITSFICT